MEVLSSHLLNSLNGHHAANVKIYIFKINLKGDKNLFFETATDEGGRILKELELTEEDCLCTFEMIIKTGEYFKNESIKIFNKRIVSEIVVRFNMEDPNKKYHIPIIVSPNSYSIWWSD